MKLIVKYFPEIIVKSQPVRKRFSQMLEGNIRNMLRRIDSTVTVRWGWSQLMVTSKANDHKLLNEMMEMLRNTPGVDCFYEVTEFPFETVEDIIAVVNEHYRGLIADKTFCVRVKRRGKHAFNSIELERRLGHELGKVAPTAKVKLNNPESPVMLEVETNRLFLVGARHQGLGGFPLGSQEAVLSLISGGYDSSVSSYMMIRRGMKVHYCFFNLGGRMHEIGVKETAWYLWQRFGSSHKVKFFSVPFEDVVREILETIDNGHMGVVLKRMMVRAASRIAERLNVDAIVTGEAVGQVSSQTLANLREIDRVADMLILRPLNTMDKQAIIDLSKAIGTEDLAKTMPEYCGVISNRPTVKAKRERLEAEEDKFDFDVLEQALENVKAIDIRSIGEQTDKDLVQVDTVNSYLATDMVIDIRSPEEEEESPLELEGVEVKHIPFYRLQDAMKEMEKSRRYLLYCDRGVMSKLQALYLIEAGISNVKVYKP